MKLLPRWHRGAIVRRLFANKTASIALAFILLLVVVALVSNVWTPQNPNSQDLLAPLQGPSMKHWLGTDAFGRDMLSRLMVATRISLIATAEGVGIAVIIGIPTGFLAGYIGGVLDAVMSRIADAFLSLPGLILAMAIVGMLGPNLTNAMLAIGIVLSPGFFRIARASAGSVRQEIYIEAVRALGCSLWRTLWRHVVPNASSPLLVQASFSAGIVITAEASLSFLGLGVQPPTPSWGSMVRDGFNDVHTSAFSMIPPAVMIVLAIVAFQLLGDGLRDAMGRQSSVVAIANP